MELEHCLYTHAHNVNTHKCTAHMDRKRVLSKQVMVGEKSCPTEESRWEWVMTNYITVYNHITVTISCALTGRWRDRHFAENTKRNNGGEVVLVLVSGMKTARLSNFHSKHCPGPLKFPFGSVATREIEQNRQRMVLSQLPVGIQPEGLNMLLNMNYSLSPWYILSDGVCLYCATADMLRAGTKTTSATGAATKWSVIFIFEYKRECSERVPC